jgi:hypothetical protein
MCRVICAVGDRRGRHIAHHGVDLISGTAVKAGKVRMLDVTAT